MTREEAIAKLKNFADHCYPNEEFLIAIQSLEQEPCEDAISRQETIEAFQMFRGYEANRTNAEWVDRIETVVKKLPPVTPQPKTDDMTSSHSELDIYKGCIDLMNDLLRQVYEWLEIVGIDVSEMDEDEQFATHFYTTEIVERLFLWKTSHSGGTSQRMKLKELGITDDAVLFDFAKMIEPQESEVNNG